MQNNSVSLHRVIKTTPDKVFRAFSDAKALASWLPPYGFLCEVEHLDVRTGGSYRASFTNFSTGHSHSFGGHYEEVKPNEYLRYTDGFDNPDFPEKMLTNVWIKAVSVGTEIRVTQENIPAAIPAEACYLGWQDSLEKLMKLVEPVIPDTI